MKTKKVSSNEEFTSIVFWNEVLDRNQMGQIKGGDGGGGNGGQNDPDDDWGQ